MTHTVRAERNISVNADTLWKTIEAMTGMEDWYSGLIRESEVREAEGSQPSRTCMMQDGGVLNERILLRDGATRTFVYAIDSHPLPARNVVGTIRIDDLGDGQSHVVWSAQMMLDPTSAEQMRTMVTRMYEQGLASLESHHNAKS